MIDFITSADNLPFTISLGIMLTVAAIEGVGLLLGAGLSSIFDSIFPDLDMDVDTDVDADLDAEIESPSFFSKFFSWLLIGKVPVMVIILIFLTYFGLLGFILQSIVKDIVGIYLPWFLAIWAPLFLSLPLVRGTSKLVSKIFPEDETEAVSSSSFIGKIAMITIGTAKKSEPTEAKLIDQYGQTHYFLVEPETDEFVFKQGEKALIIKEEGSKYIIIPVPIEKLTD